MSFVTKFESLVPWWLLEREGRPTLASLAVIKGDFTARAKLGLLARFPEYAPDDIALAAHGRVRRVPRGIGESSTAYAARIVSSFDDLRTAGNPHTLCKQIQGYLNAPCVVRTVDRNGNWFTRNADGTTSSNITSGVWSWDTEITGPRWSRFWVVIYPVGGTTPWALSSGVPFASRTTIGTTATANQVTTLRSIIRDWKPDGTHCEWIVVSYDSTYFEPTSDPSKLPSGASGDWSTIVDGVRVTSRFSSARYFSGSEGWP